MPERSPSNSVALLSVICAGIAAPEMLRTFNCGIGLVAVVAEKSSGHVIEAFQQCGDKAMRIGHVVAGAGEAKVVYRGALKL